MDALDPDVLTNLIRENTLSYLDLDLWEEQRIRQESERQVLNKASQKWRQVTAFLRGLMKCEPQ